MKKFLLSLLATATLVGCGSKDDNEPVYSPEDGKTIVKNTMESVYDCFKKANDGSFADFLFQVNKKSGDNTWAEYLGEKFYDQYDTQKNGGFNFQELKGIYTWNVVTKEWSKTGSSSNITWIFPATANDTNLNGRAVLENYQDKVITVESDSERFPVKGHIIITVDNKKVAEMKLNNVTFEENTNFLFPNHIDLTIYTEPFTTTVKLTKRTAEEFLFDFSLSSPKGCTTVLRANAKLTSSNYNSFTSVEEAFDNINLIAIQNDLQLVAKVDVKAIHKAGKKIGDLTTEEVNTYVKAELFKVNGGKIADVKYAVEGDDDIIYFIYSDGSKVKAEEYVSDFQEKVKNIFKRFFNE